LFVHVDSLKLVGGLPQALECSEPFVLFKLHCSGIVLSGLPCPIKEEI